VFNVPAGTAQHIGTFYATVIGALLAHGDIQPTAPGVSGSSVRVLCGHHQALVFRETALPCACCAAIIRLSCFAKPRCRCLSTTVITFSSRSRTFPPYTAGWLICVCGL